MPAKPKPIPQGYHTITPHFVVNNAVEAIEFYKKAFGAQERGIMRTPDGKRVLHAEIKIGDSILMLADEFPGAKAKSPKTLGSTTMALLLYVEDTDALFNRAVSAGAQAEMKPENAFWGDRFASVIDPFGHHWQIATHIEDVSEAEMEKRAAAKFGEMSKSHGG